MQRHANHPDPTFDMEVSLGPAGLYPVWRWTPLPTMMQCPPPPPPRMDSALTSTRRRRRPALRTVRPIAVHVPTVTLRPTVPPWRPFQGSLAWRQWSRLVKRETCHR